MIVGMHAKSGGEGRTQNAMLFATEWHMQGPDFGDIIYKTATSGPLGLVALSLLVVAFLSLRFFEKDSTKIRIWIFSTVAILAFGVIIVPSIVIYMRQGPTTPSSAGQTSAPAGEKISPQPTTVTNSAKTHGDDSPATAGNGNTINQQQPDVISKKNPKAQR